MLSFPQALSERQCLKLSAAIKAGQGGALRAALAPGHGTDPEREWAELQRVIAKIGKESRGARATRRRSREPGPGREVRPRRDYIPLANGRAIRHVHDGQGHALRFEGPVDAILIDDVMDEIRRLLEPYAEGPERDVF